VAIVVMRAAWTDFERLTYDLSHWLENEHNHEKARLLMRALAYIYWQKNVIEETKGENATLEAMLRAK
jgi:uncharacterized protein YaeQ